MGWGPAGYPKGGTRTRLGLDSIRHVAERYNGYCAVSHTDDEFTVKVVLALE